MRKYGIWTQNQAQKIWNEKFYMVYLMPSRIFYSDDTFFENKWPLPVGHLGNPPSLQPKIVIAFVTPLGHEQLIGLHRLKALWEKKQITPATNQKISDK